MDNQQPSSYYIREGSTTIEKVIYIRNGINKLSRVILSNMKWCAPYIWS